MSDEEKIITYVSREEAEEIKKRARRFRETEKRLMKKNSAD